MVNPNKAFRHREGGLMPEKQNRINMHQAKLLNRLSFETGLNVHKLYRTTFPEAKPKMALGFLTKDEAAEIIHRFREYLFDYGD